MHSSRNTSDHDIVKIYTHDKLQSEGSFNRTAFIFLAVMMGGDYNPVRVNLGCALPYFYMIFRKDFGGVEALLPVPSATQTLHSSCMPPSQCQAGALLARSWLYGGISCAMSCPVTLMDTLAAITELWLLRSPRRSPLSMRQLCMQGH